MEKVISFCLTGRNDNYTIDFVYRIETTINFIACELEKAGKLDKVEILIVDWASEAPLSEVLKLNGEAADISRFIYIPPKLVQAYFEQNIFHTAVAINTALRRAAAKYRITCGADILFPSCSLKNMLDFFEGKIHIEGFDPENIMTICGRYSLPWHLVKEKPSVKEWQRYLALNTWNYRKDESMAPSFMHGAAGALILSEKLWSECRGYDESQSGWGWVDMDLVLRLTQYYPWLELSSIGVQAFNMEHSFSDNRTQAQKKQNDHIYNPVLSPNGEHWGLGKENFEKEKIPARSERHKRGKMQFCRPFSEDLIKACDIDFTYDVISAILKSGRLQADYGKADFLRAFLCVFQCSTAGVKRFMHIGMKRAYSSIAVAAYSKNTEIYGIDHWSGMEAPFGPNDIGLLLNGPLAAYQGYCRFLNGELCTAVTRLKNSLSRDFSFDLILIEENVFEGEELKTQVQALAGLLGHGASIIVSDPGDCLSGFACGDISVTSFKEWHTVMLTKDKRGMHSAHSLPALVDDAFARLPEHKRKAIWKNLEKLIPGTAKKGSIIYPAGKYIKEFFANIGEFYADGPHILMFIDDSINKNGTKYLGLPVRLPSEVRNEDFDAVIVASDYLDEELTGKCLALYGPSCKIINLYELEKSY